MATVRVDSMVVKTAGLKVSNMAVEREFVQVQLSVVVMAFDLDEIQAAPLVNLVAFEMA